LDVHDFPAVDHAVMVAVETAQNSTGVCALLSLATFRRVGGHGGEEESEGSECN
jgi:hypothetical protein